MKRYIKASDESDNRLLWEEVDTVQEGGYVIDYFVDYMDRDHYVCQITEWGTGGEVTVEDISSDNRNFPYQHFYKLEDIYPNRDAFEQALNRLANSYEPKY